MNITIGEKGEMLVLQGLFVCIGRSSVPMVVI